MATKAEQKPKPGSIEEQRRNLPDAPGVYIFRDRNGDALYVGKANSVRKRVASHFSGRSSSSPEMLKRADSIEVLLTATEA